MRTLRPLDALFPRIRQGLLAATFGHPERWWFLTELAQRLETAPSSLQRELDALTVTGLLERRREGRRTYYRAQRHASIFHDLQGLVRKTLGAVEQIRTRLAPFRQRIRCAFVYGSVAGRRETAHSDLDVMVLGSVGLAELARAMRPVERRLRREVNFTVFREAEFRRQLRAGSHFLTSVLKGRKTFIRGDARELETITRQ